MTDGSSKNPGRRADRSAAAASLLGVAALLAACQPLDDAGHPEAVSVVHVIDGDTVIVERNGDEERVRLLGIDAPEVAHGGKPGEPCADEATELTERLTATTAVEIIPDTTQAETDQYGRTLAYIEANGQDVSAELLRAGLAEVYYSAPDINRYGDYEKLAAQADRPSCAE